MHRIAKRNHYNPCFWTALWNHKYYDAVITNGQQPSGARKQTVFALNVRSNKIVPTTVENVHFDRDLGLAEITPAAANRFCERWFAKEYARFVKAMEAYPETVFIDFEPILTAIENQPAYSTLMDV